MRRLLFRYLRKFYNKALIIFTTIILFFLVSVNKVFSEDDVFTIDNIIVEGRVNLNFSRDKYLDEAFLESFNTLASKILLSKDLQKIKNVELKKIKNLINSFQILEETYSKDKFKAKIKIHFDDRKVKKFLAKKNISFSQPANISAVFFPVLFVNTEIKSLNENFFYKNWQEVKIKNELIDYILPLEDLENISEIVKMKNRIEDLNIDKLVNKYDVQNYVFALMDYQSKKINIYIKTNFNRGITSKNFSYKINNMKDEIALSKILEDLKLKISDIWKEENLVNLSMPLLINIKFKHKNLKDLERLKNTFQKISIIDNSDLEEFNINNSLFKIYYYGNPKKLKSELLRFGYELNGDQGFWQLYLNE